MQLTLIKDNSVQGVKNVDTFHVTRNEVIVEFSDGTEAVYDELVRGFAE